MKNIVLVAINLTHNSEFEKKSFDDQLSMLAFFTLRTYRAVKKLHPEAYVIVAWREYGLSNHVSVSQNNINKFKQFLSQVTKERELLIIAGSLVSQKLFVVNDKQEKIKQIEAAYDNYQFIQELEYTKNNSYFFVNYKRQFSLANAQHSFSTIKNTCYFFKEGKKAYRRHKIAPYQEIPKEAQKPSAYTFKEQEFLFTLDAQNNITIGVEMCFEHSLGLLHHLVKTKSLAAPTIHIIISDSNTLEPKYACGDYTVRIDSDPSDSINFAKKEEAEDDFFQVYQFDPYQDKNLKFQKIKPDICDFTADAPTSLLQNINLN